MPTSLSAMGWNFIWFEFVQVLRMLSQCLWVHVCTVLLYLEDTASLELPTTPGSYGFSTSFCIEPWTLRGRLCEVISFKTACFKVSHFAPCPLLGFCVNFHLLQEEASVMRVDQYSGYINMSLGASSYCYLFCRIIVVGFPHDSPALGFFVILAVAVTGPISWSRP